MYLRKFGVFLLAVMAYSSLAMAIEVTVVHDVVTHDIYGNPLPLRNPTGDTYTHVPGIGNLSAGFGVTGTLGDSLFDQLADPIGTDVASNNIVSNETLVTNGATHDLSIELASFDAAGAPAEIWPGGFLVGGLPATFGAVFLGDNALGNNLDFTGGPPLLVSASITLYDTAGAVAGGPFDILSSLGGAGAPWDGSYGFQFGDGSAGAGVSRIVANISVSKVPEPAAGITLLLGLVSLGIARYRRVS